MQMPGKNVKDCRAPFEELPNEMSLEDLNPTSKSEYNRLKYIEDNILAALCGHKKCKCCNSVKSIISEIVSFNLLKMTPNDSGFSPQSTGSWKVNYEIPGCSLDSSDSDAYLPPIKVLSNVTIQKQGESNRLYLKGNKNKTETAHLKCGQNTTESGDNAFQSEAEIQKVHETINEENKKVPVKKNRRRKSQYIVPGSKSHKPKIKESTSPLKQAKIPGCSPDTSAKNVYLVTLDKSERFKEKSQAAESDSNEFLNEADHIRKDSELVKEGNKKMAAKKRQKRKSKYVVPGSKPHKPKLKEGTFPLESAQKRTTAEQKDDDDENIENFNHKKNMGAKGKKRKSGGDSTERPMKKQKSNWNQSGREVDVSSTPLERSKMETRKSSSKGNQGTSALSHKFMPQRLVFSPDCCEEEINEGNDKQKMDKSESRSEGACKGHETPPLEETLEVQPKRSNPVRHPNFLNGGDRAATLTEVFYKSNVPQANSKARSYIYTLIDNKKFKISHDRTKSATFSKAVLKRLSRSGGCAITLGASFLERESLRLHPMKNHKSIYSPTRWLTSKLFDDMCLYD